jgi:hypothetical protein
VSRRCRTAAALLAVLGLPVPAGGEEALPCRAEASVEPTRAVVGQQVLYQLHILTHHRVVAVEWVSPPSFPGFRAEPLPGRPQAGGGREEQRALFPERAGVLLIRVGGVRCRLREGREVVAPVPDVALHVDPLPARGRPPGFSGLVGPLLLAGRVTPRQVALGGSVRVELELRGSGNLWDAPDPLADVSLPGGAELFRERPALALEPGPELFVRREFHYDVVPRRPGVLSLPPVRVDYFDPGTRRYAVALVEGVDVAVTPRPPGAGAGSNAGSDENEAAPRTGPKRRTLLSAASALCALAVVAAGIAAWRRRRGRRGPSST